jgi:predicted secreted hydrolase
MRGLPTWSLPWLAVALIVLGAWWLWPGGDAASPRLLDPAALAAALPAAGDDGFAELDLAADWTPELPQDLGPHPAVRAERWDLTGRVRDGAGRRYGLRLTLVRLGLRAPGEDGVRASKLAADALLLGRVALVPEDGEPLRAERASRTAAGLAGATADPPEVWLEDWRLRLAWGDGAGDGGAGRLTAAAEGTRLELALTPEKPVVTPAANLLTGAGAAGPDTGPAFRWLAEPRLGLSGRLLRRGTETRVSGSAWLDHIWGAAGGAGAGLAGTRGPLALNRFLLQLDDGSELLCIHLRRRAGGGTPVPTCLVIASDGDTRVLRRRALTLAPKDATWRSSDGAADYPVAWRLEAPGLDLSLDIRALQPAQELVLGERLWSGAVAVDGEHAGRSVAGGGRMDLSGYAGADG